MSFIDRLVARRGSRTVGLNEPGVAPRQQSQPIVLDPYDLSGLADDLGIDYNAKAIMRDRLLHERSPDTRDLGG
jgi:hypothetical protein